LIVKDIIVFTMIRRTPTRIELKLEDISEYEQLKREAEAKRATSKHNLLGSSPLKEEASNNEPIAPAHTKADIATMHQRIGFDPTPKLN